MDKYKRFIFEVICSFLLTLAGNVHGENSYVLVAPNVVRPGSKLTIHGTLLKPRSEIVTITADLHGDQEIAASTVFVARDKSAVKLDLMVPANIDIGVKKTLRLKVEGSGGLTFTNSKTINLEKKSVSVYIQTDKAIYKPGQTVNFRVFGTTPDLKVVNDKLEVELLDPKGNKISRWSVSGAEMNSVNNVYVQEQVMSAEPVLGDWTLKAKLLSHNDEFEEKSFEVAEYVLPKFSVDLDLPSFGRSDIDIFRGKVKARYTFGQPVKGIIDLRVSSSKTTSTPIQMNMPINGETEFSIKISELDRLKQSLKTPTFLFEVNVTEDNTKQRQSDEKEITFYDHPIKLKFHKPLPDTFKPGMIFDAVVIVSQQDDTAPDSINGKLKVTITEYRRKTHRIIPLPDPIPRPIPFGPVNLRGPVLPRFRRLAPSRIWMPPPREISKVLPPVYYTIPVDGFVTFPINVHKDMTKLKIKAEYSGISVTKTLKKRHSPSGTYLQMRLLSKTPTAGNAARIEVKSTKKTKEFTYQIYSRGSIVEFGTVSMRGRTSIEWKPQITAAMAPRTKIVAYFVRSDGEIVADVLVMNVDGPVYDNKVGIQFDKHEVAPGDKVQLKVTADAGSDVHVMAVDKSVLILASGNDITNKQVLQELTSFDTKTKGQSFPIFCDWSCLRWPVPVGGKDVKDVFNDAGVIIFTDALVYEYNEPPVIRPRPKPRWGIRRFNANVGREFNAMAMDVAANERQLARPMAVPAIAKQSIPLAVPDIDKSLSDLAPVKRTRKLFPETWFWQSGKVPSNGSVSFEEIVPDTITSWIASAYAVHPNTGLGVANPTPELPASLKFFVIANLPYSVIRTEKVIIQVTVHNYTPRDLFTFVELSKSDQFNNIMISGTRESETSMDVYRTTSVRSNGIHTFYFPIKPLVNGLIDIKISARSISVSDKIHKRLLVEPEGTPREYNIPLLADLQGNTITKNGQVKYPPRKVSGSEVVKATVIGDMMGPSLSGLDTLLKLPSGCGEQNMLKFAPNIFILKYLKATDTIKTIKDDILKKAYDYLKTGYQRELKYAHADGSFSAFGERDSSGSTWLTAFVLKSFVQARPYTFIDDNVIRKAVKWLITQQREDGTFKEPGRVIHKAMQGGSAGGTVALTAFVFISLLEAREIKGVDTRILGAQTKARSYLESQVTKLSDVYDFAIVLYALELAGSVKADYVWNELDSKAIIEGGTKHWERVTKVKDIAKPWAKRNGVAIDIEMSSYVLLSLAYQKNRIEGVKVMKWIAEQRNPKGGFSSTQDTVLALQSLAEMAALVYSPRHDVTVTLSGNGFYDTLYINNLNAQVLQIRELPPDVGTVTATFSGTGLSLVEIGVTYNIDDDDEKQSFDLNISLLRESLDNFEVKACARWLEKGSSSMAVLEIGSPSGFISDISSLHTEPKYKRVEMDIRKLILYFDEIGATETCATVTMQRIGMVAGAQPVACTVYDYYEPLGKQRTKLYNPKAIQNSEVCEVCPQCGSCQKT